MKMKRISPSIPLCASPVWRTARSAGGFSLAEMLVVIAVIGVLAGMAILAMSGVMDKSNHAKVVRQAQAVAHTYAAARAAGAEFPVQSRAGVVDLLTQGNGVQGKGVFSDSRFVVPMGDEERNAVRTSSLLVESIMPDGSFYLQFQP